MGGLQQKYIHKMTFSKKSTFRKTLFKKGKILTLSSLYILYCILIIKCHNTDLYNKKSFFSIIQGKKILITKVYGICYMSPKHTIKLKLMTLC